MEVRYFGHSSFQVSLGNRVLLFDPWFDETHPERIVPPETKSQLIKKCDLILVSHEHFDHASPKDVEDICERTFAQVIGPEEALALFKVNPRLKIPVSAGESFNLLGVDITVVPARHPQSENAIGFVVEAEGKSVYFAGDTYEFSEMRNLEVDCAILPIGGTYTMDLLGAISALKSMRAKYVIPMHYNTFPRIRCDRHDFVQRVKRDTRSIPVVLAPGEAFSL